MIFSEYPSKKVGSYSDLDIITSRCLRVLVWPSVLNALTLSFHFCVILVRVLIISSFPLFLRISLDFLASLLFFISHPVPFLFDVYSGLLRRFEQWLFALLNAVLTFFLMAFPSFWMAAVDRLVCDVFRFSGNGFLRMTGNFMTLSATVMSAVVRSSEDDWVVTWMKEEVMMGIEVEPVVCRGIGVKGGSWFVPMRCGNSAIIGGVWRALASLAWEGCRLEGISLNREGDFGALLGVGPGETGIRSFKGD